MRIVFSDQQGTHLLAVSLPDADVIAGIRRTDSKSGEVFFGRGDTTDEKPWKVTRKTLLTAGRKLANMLSQFDKPRVKQLSVQMDDGTTRGPAKMMTGFTTRNAPVMLERSHLGRFILWILREDGSDEECDLTGLTSYRLDQGTVLIEYTTAKSAFAEMVSRIDTIFQEVKSESMWIHIEY